MNSWDKVADRHSHFPIINNHTQSFTIVLLTSLPTICIVYSVQLCRSDFSNKSRIIILPMRSDKINQSITRKSDQLIKTYHVVQTDRNRKQSAERCLRIRINPSINTMRMWVLIQIYNKFCLCNKYRMVHKFCFNMNFEKFTIILDDLLKIYRYIIYKYFKGSSRISKSSLWNGTSGPSCIYTEYPYNNHKWLWSLNR